MEEIIEGLVKSYMRDQWIQRHRDIGHYAAKEELLSHGRIIFTEPGTMNIKYVFKDPEFHIPYQVPVYADSYGQFPKMHLDGDYSIVIRDRDDANLHIATTREEQ